MSLTADYKASVEQRGGYFFDALPASAVSRNDVGKVGARLPAYSPTRDYAYEVAPVSVQLEHGGRNLATTFLDSITTYAADNPLGVSTWDEDVDYAKNGVQQIKDRWEEAKRSLPNPTLLDLLAFALGIDKTVLFVILLLVGYLMLRQLGVVPALNKVLS